jgi:Mg2+ and Co2+ transporter CorA
MKKQYRKRADDLINSGYANEIINDLYNLIDEIINDLYNLIDEIINDLYNLIDEILSNE